MHWRAGVVEAGTAKSLSFSSPSPWAQNAGYEPSQNAPSVLTFCHLCMKQHLTTTLLLLLGLLHDLLDDLLLLNEEGADDAVADAVGAAGATVGTLDGLLGAGDLGVLAGTESGDLCCVSINFQSFIFSWVCCDQGGRTPGSLTPQSPHLGEVPLFLM